MFTFIIWKKSLYSLYHIIRLHLQLKHIIAPLHHHTFALSSDIHHCTTSAPTSLHHCTTILLH